jgi:hypothetical protein
MPLGRSRRRWEDGIKLNLRKIVWGVGLDWIHLAQFRIRWQAVVNAVINLPVPAPRTYIYIYVYVYIYIYIYLCIHTQTWENISRLHSYRAKMQIHLLLVSTDHAEPWPPRTWEFS